MKKVMTIVLMLSLIAGFTANCRKQDVIQEEPGTSEKEMITEKVEMEEKKDSEIVLEKADKEVKVIHEEEEELKIPVQEKVSLQENIYYVSPDGLDTNEGSERSAWSLTKANEMVEPGDTVILLDGKYDTSIAPARSGKKDGRIIYKAANFRKPFFTGMEAAVIVSGRSYITIDSITARIVKRFVIAVNSHHITVNGCHFENAYGWMGLRFKNAGDGLRITNNILRDGTDIVRIYPGDDFTTSDYHYIENNVFDCASHALLAMIGTQRSVVRNNTFLNTVEKALELQVAKIKTGELRPIMYTLFENNYIAYTGNFERMGTSSPGIFTAGKHCIFRRNIIMHCQYGGSYYGGSGKGEAGIGYGHRTYNNVFFENGRSGAFKACGPGLLIGGGGPNWGDHVFANNIFLGNEWFPGVHTKDLPQSLQISINSKNKPGDAVFFGNLIMHKEPGEKVIGLVNWRGRGGRTFTVADYEKAFPNAAWRNIEADPQFVGPEKGDFRLQQTSPCIDAGVPLTKTSEAGSGKTLKVEDPYYFFDGFGLIEPDVIRVGGKRVQIERVDYDNRIIILRASISWSAGDPVNVDYQGEAPDIGAVEFGASTKKVGASSEEWSIRTKKQLPEWMLHHRETPKKWWIKDQGKVLKKIFEEGTITREEFNELVKQLDAMDGTRDGYCNIEILKKILGVSEKK